MTGFVEDAVIEVHTFDHAVVTIAQYTTLILFSDGKHNLMDRRFLPPEYTEIAKWAGYLDDVRGYNIQHDLIHMIRAEYLGLSWCPVLHDPYPGPLCDAPKEHQNIEYEVNAIQRMIRLQPDPDPYGNLHWVTDQFLRDVDKMVG